ncbi:MAG: arylsulfotransferase family protein, partial [Halobacteriota archaeon]
CTHTGFRVIDPDPEPRVVSEYSFPVRTRQNSEVHDVELLPSGEFLMSDMEHERILTVKGGEVTWQWNASELYEAPEDPTREDWLHINDVDRIDDGRYLVSVRNANQLVVVDRDEGAVEVVNEDHDPDDGQRQGDPELMKRQHNPQWLDDGAILVADSENNRIIELHEVDGEWEVAWSVEQAEGVELFWPRDADRLENGNTLVTDSANQRIFEVNESGDVVWSYKTDLIPYEAERLPEGETVGATLYNPPDGYESEETASESGSGIPLLTPLLSIVRTSFPLPFWVSEVHLLVTLVSVGLVGAGLGVVGRSVLATRR